jgi:hypothetical protein
VYAHRGDVEGLIREAEGGAIWLRSDSRAAAARRLGRLRDPRATPVLVGLLEDADLGVRVMAAQALGLIADPAAVPALTRLVGDPVAFAREYRPQSTGEVWTQSRDRSRPWLDTGGDRFWAVCGLVRLGARVEVMPALLALLQHDQRSIRVWASGQIAALGEIAAIAEIESVQAHEPFWWRWRYATALRRLRRLRQRADSSSPRP